MPGIFNFLRAASPPLILPLVRLNCSSKFSFHQLLLGGTSVSSILLLSELFIFSTSGGSKFFFKWMSYDYEFSACHACENFFIGNRRYDESSVPEKPKCRARYFKHLRLAHRSNLNRISSRIYGDYRLDYEYPRSKSAIFFNYPFLFFFSCNVIYKDNEVTVTHGRIDS